MVLSVQRFQEEIVVLYYTSCIEISVLIRLQAHGQHHVEEILLAVDRDDDGRRNTGVELHLHPLGWGIAQRVHQITVVETDLQPLPVARDAADVLCVAVGGLGRHRHLVLAELAAHGALELFTDDDAHALKALEHRFRVEHEVDGISAST